MNKDEISIHIANDINNISVCNFETDTHKIAIIDLVFNTGIENHNNITNDINVSNNIEMIPEMIPQVSLIN
ncbi:MAG: hypothetical protein PHN88_11205 [Ignavibacteria bacterium]|nr:hypothetical protein [Ignavibacteria bacterium]